jgi:NAD(P)H-dependent flavin oxidoreductase YrpB (nitropropane dioxygenase family)
MKTQVTELPGIRYPIIQGGMQWVGTAELASAVSNAGGLGILTALTQPTPEDLRKEIARCRAMTDKPFGVNLTILPAITPPPYADYLEVIIESGVRIVETAGNNPKEFIGKLKACGTRIVRSGDVHGGVVSAGMVIGLIDDVPSCAELIDRIVRDCRSHLNAAVAMVAV